MFSNSVIENLNIFKDNLPCLPASTVMKLIDAFFFQSTQKTFSKSPAKRDHNNFLLLTYSGSCGSCLTVL